MRGPLSFRGEGHSPVTSSSERYRLSCPPAFWPLPQPRGRPAIAEYTSAIDPILEKHCYECHGDGYDKGKVAFDALGSPSEDPAAGPVAQGAEQHARRAHARRAQAAALRRRAAEARALDQVQRLQDRPAQSGSRPRDGAPTEPRGIPQHRARSRSASTSTPTTNSRPTTPASASTTSATRSRSRRCSWRNTSRPRRRSSPRPCPRRRASPPKQVRQRHGVRRHQRARQVGASANSCSAKRPASPGASKSESRARTSVKFDIEVNGDFVSGPGQGTHSCSRSTARKS